MRFVRGRAKGFLFEIIRSKNRSHLGRKGIISLAALNNQFVGSLGSWPEIATDLKKRKLINSELGDRIRLIYLFGRLIGNTDMHNWNLSFFCQKFQITGLAPVYDMLPMFFAPQNEQIIDRKLPIPKPTLQDRNVWKECFKMANSFWRAVQQDKRISTEFKITVNHALEVLKQGKAHFNKLPQ